MVPNNKKRNRGKRGKPLWRDALAKKISRMMTYAPRKEAPVPVALYRGDR